MDAHAGQEGAGAAQPMSADAIRILETFCHRLEGIYGFYQETIMSFITFSGVMKDRVNDPTFPMLADSTFAYGGTLNANDPAARYTNRTLPIPEWDEDKRSVMAAASERASYAARDRLALQVALARRIRDLCPPGRDPKLTTRLQEWWTLPDFAAFRAEVKKAFKADIPLAERSAWEDWITRDRAEIARLTAEIAEAESEIDRIVYELFDLTPDEVALLESAI